ncbi:twin-arginine translocase TatA/TatE family subunit [Parvularcula sp. IMCC14364]|uniref:twin-arginine translocase TatA/TatE family subunit n=1 Tax=Parvularcula sp. IMCC14364 TaxID=3067902 RepID=UPI002740DC76|nr:twin-arginine translocase TatA/TatE family subunit [Parvularcula sp. IMCC14364]
MGAVGPWQIVLVIILALLLFGGRGRISSIMGDFAKGIKSFRKGMEDEEKAIATDDEEKKSAASLKAEDIEDVKVKETTKASS